MYPNYPTVYRIGPTTLTASIFTFLGVAIIIASTRLFLRFRTFRRFGPDDVVLMLAVVFFTASCGTTEAARDLDFIQMEVNSGAALPTPDFPNQMLLYNKLDTAESILQWSTIFAVKFSYMLFFRPLISRVRFLEIWWWCVMAVLIPAAIAAVAMSIYVCPYYDMSFLEKCVYSGNIISHESNFLIFTTAVDIATDVLVISLPVALLCKVHLELRRKLALGAILCLSVFMIIIASVRIALVNIPTRDGSMIPDTTWLFFWQSLEACVGIVMVSLTAFRSLYGQERAKNKKGDGYDYVNESSAQRNAARRLNISAPKAFASIGTTSHGSPHGADAWAQEEELKVIGRAHTRDQVSNEAWDFQQHERQQSRDKNPPSPMPESFV